MIQDVINRLLTASRIAIVGLSDDPSRPSYAIANYLQSVGKQIIPVNPQLSNWMGVKCYASLDRVPGQIDLVNVFRRADACPQIVRAAIKIKAGGIWLQSGIISEESRRMAQEAKVDFVQDRCIMVEHARQSV